MLDSLFFPFNTSSSPCSIPLEADLYSLHQLDSLTFRWVWYIGGTRRLEGMKKKAGLSTQFSLPELHVGGGCVFLLKSAAAGWGPSLVTAALDGSGNPFYHLLLQSVTANIVTHTTPHCPTTPSSHLWTCLKLANQLPHLSLNYHFDHAISFL